MTRTVIAAALAAQLAIASVARADPPAPSPPPPAEPPPAPTQPPFAPAQPLPASTQPAPPPKASIATPDGTLITITSTTRATTIYLAHGDVPAGTLPDPFERMGIAPLTVSLPPGTYTIEATGPSSSDGRTVFSVEASAPMTVEVHAGDASVRTVGSVLIGLGIVSTLLGVFAIVSISADDKHYNRWGIGLPLVLGGLGGTGIGIAMTSLGATDIRVPNVPPHRATRSAWIPTLVARF
jgi:hypothetical protein